MLDFYYKDQQKIQSLAEIDDCLGDFYLKQLLYIAVLPFLLLQKLQVLPEPLVIPDKDQTLEYIFDMR